MTPRASERWEGSPRIRQPHSGRGIRGLLHASVIAAAAITGTIQAAAQETRSAINEHLKSIPGNLPHLAAKEELLREDAKHGLIVIRQIHWAPDLTQREAEIVERCQREVKAMLEALLEKGLIDEVYNEGRMTDGEPTPDPLYAYYDSPQEQGIVIDRIAECGAVHVLEEEGKLVVKGAERTAEYDRSGKVLNDPFSLEKYDAVFEDRENVLLKIVEEAQDDIACTVFGSAHYWENNVRDHPAGFSLVTLTPNAVAENDRIVLGQVPPPPPEPSAAPDESAVPLAVSDAPPPPPEEE